MEYAQWYDEHAAVVDLNPGEMLHWPLNSPHRVDNHDCLNVSMTTEYWTDPIRRNVMMNCGNAVLRHKLGITPRSHSLSGPGSGSRLCCRRVPSAPGCLSSSDPLHGRSLSSSIRQSRAGSSILCKTRHSRPMPDKIHLAA